MGENLSPHPINPVVLHEIILWESTVVNGAGEIVTPSEDGVEIISKTEEKKRVKIREPTKGRLISQCIEGLNVDKNNNIYIVTHAKLLMEDSDEEFLSYMLYIIDDKQNVKCESVLDWLEAYTSCKRIMIAINQSNDIILIKLGDPNIYVFDDTGLLKHKFKRCSRALTFLNVTEKNEILIRANRRKAFQFYSQEGDLMSTIIVPKHHRIVGAAFHYVTGKIIVLTNMRSEKYGYFVLIYSADGDMKAFSCLCKEPGFYLHKITSHPNGPVAVLGPSRIIYI